jgi:lipopolysaccharide transport system permease protein
VGAPIAQDLWRCGERFQMLVRRDLSMRYKQAAIGALWPIIGPFLIMLIFTVIFERIAGSPSGGEPLYAPMGFAGMMLWTLFFDRVDRGIQ